jgi:hypothetical protein
VVPLSETENWKLNLIEEVSIMRKGQLEVTEFDDRMDCPMFFPNNTAPPSTGD